MSERGGAFLVEDSQLVLRNTDLTSNSAGADGGAIHMENSIVHLEGVRIANNSGPSIISVLGADSTELSLRYVTLTSSGNSTFPILISNEGGSGTDQPGVPDRIPGNHFDLGFDEWFGAVSGIFSDGFESGDTSAWSLATP